MKIRIMGTGGQGVVLASVILGRAAIYDKKNAVQTQEYGSAARGGPAKADVIIDDKPIIDITFEEPDVLILLSKESLAIIKSLTKSLSKKCKVIADSSLNARNAISRPFIAAAYGLGSPLSANIIVLGFLSKLGIASLKALEKSINELLPEKDISINKKALHKGFEL